MFENKKAGLVSNLIFIIAASLFWVSIFLDISALKGETSFQHGGLLRYVAFAIAMSSLLFMVENPDGAGRIDIRKGNVTGIIFYWILEGISWAILFVCGVSLYMVMTDVDDANADLDQIEAVAIASCVAFVLWMITRHVLASLWWGIIKDQNKRDAEKA